MWIMFEIRQKFAPAPPTCLYSHGAPLTMFCHAILVTETTYSRYHFFHCQYKMTMSSICPLLKSTSTSSTMLIKIIFHRFIHQKVWKRQCPKSLTWIKHKHEYKSSDVWLLISEVYSGLFTHYFRYCSLYMSWFMLTSRFSIWDTGSIYNNTGVHVQH